MNAVLISILIMLLLSYMRVQVIVALLLASILAGLLSGLSLETTINAFNIGITNGASIALSYALLGAFAVAISTSGLPQVLANFAVDNVAKQTKQQRLKWTIIIIIGLVSIASQNVIPIHIAFVPLLIPPLLYVISQLRIDRRLIACIIVFGLVTPYMFLPIGFGEIFLKQILLKNIDKSGLNVDHVNVMYAMFIPMLGMVAGLFIAIFYSYSKPRDYKLIKDTEHNQDTLQQYSKKNIIISIIAVLFALVVQLYTGSMMFGALVGFLLFVVTGTVKWHKADEVFSKGVKMMAMIGFIMITAQGYAEVLKTTGEINALVTTSAQLFQGSKVMASFSMMLVGLIITMGIGSSFSTVPIIAAVYVPLCVQLGFSPAATVCLIGAAGAIGDAGSPPSDTTLSVTAGLNVDLQHDHMKDTVIPTFIHYNIPLFIAGWIGSLLL